MNIRPYSLLHVAYVAFKTRQNCASFFAWSPEKLAQMHKTLYWIDNALTNMAAGYEFNDNQVNIRPYSLRHVSYVAFVTRQNCASFFAWSPEKLAQMYKTLFWIDNPFTNMAAGYVFNDKQVNIIPYSLLHVAYVAFVTRQNCLSSTFLGRGLI